METDGLIYTPLGTQTVIDRYQFDPLRLDGPEISIKNLESEDKKVIIAVPVHMSFQGKPIVVCFMGIDMKEMLAGVSMDAQEGGAVTFDIEDVDRMDNKATLRFTMADTGIGMSKEYLPKLFEAFSQEDSSTTNRYGSTSLGMPITRSIVELMIGSIDVESEKGTTFTVTLTLTQADRQAALADNTELRPHERSVPVVDDDRIAYEHAEVIPSQVGIRCELATSGFEALDMV